MSSLIEAFANLRRDAGDLVAGWNRFWFAPQDVATVCWLRWLAGGMILYTHLVWSLSLDEFFAAPGWQPNEVVEGLRSTVPYWSLWWFVPEGLIWPAHIACLLVLAMFFIGFWTSVTSKLTYLIVVSYAHRVPLANFGLDQINAFLALYLALSPCGRVASVDWLLQRRRLAKAAFADGQTPEFKPAEPSSMARLATRLIQIQLCVLYTYAGIAKLKGDAWWNGDAIWMALANYEYQSANMLWLAWFRPITEIITHTTVLWECTFWATVWHPRLRPYVLLIGAGMHLGIGAFMGMWTFGLVMTFAYQSFVPPEKIRAIARRLIGSARSREQQIVTVRPSDHSRSAWAAAFDFSGHRTFIPTATTTINRSEIAEPICRLLFIDADENIRLHAERYFSEMQYDIRTANTWAPASSHGHAWPAQVIVWNVSGVDQPVIADVAESLATNFSPDRNERPSLIVIASESEHDDWSEVSNIVLPAPVSMRNVRAAIESELKRSIAQPVELAAPNANERLPG